MKETDECEWMEPQFASCDAQICRVRCECECRPSTSVENNIFCPLCPSSTHTRQSQSLRILIKMATAMAQVNICIWRNFNSLKYHIFHRFQFLLDSPAALE